MIIKGLYTCNGFLYFLTDKDEYILYRSATKAKFLDQSKVYIVMDLDAVRNAITTHNDEMVIQINNNRQSYEKTKNPIFSRAIKLFENAIIKNVSFPEINEEEYR